ncbi:P-loop NTPase fold protein [Peptacetobacter hominis]|nr:P-loop NTPase fold protein [Peptacetobacter hominis]
MYTDENSTKEIIINYFKDDRNRQAIMLNGEWGSGKTFFVKKILIDKLKKEFKDTNIIYLSLYGMDSIESLKKELNNEYIAKMVESKTNGKISNEKISGGISVLVELGRQGVGKIFNIDSEKIIEKIELEDFFKIGNSIIIFDDLERCSIKVNDLLGFINNMVEHKGTKVLIVANEKEIGKEELYSNLELKYMIASNRDILLESRDRKYEDKIRKSELIERTEDIFSSNIFYSRVKEKLIGITINYKPNINNLYDAILKDCIIDNDAAKEYVKSQKEIVCGTLRKEKHFNIRTMISIVLAYEKFFGIIDEIELDKELEKYKELEKKEILRRTVELLIKIKNGNMLKVEEEYKYFNDSPYVFIYDYLLYSYINESSIKENIEKRVVLSKKLADERENDEKESELFNKLIYWWKLDEEELPSLISDAKNRMKECQVINIKSILVSIIHMRKNGVKYINYEDYKDILKERFEKKPQDFKTEYFRYYYDDIEIKDDYNYIIKDLIQEINLLKGESYLKDKLNTEKIWKDEFISLCNKYKDEFMNKGKFFYYMDIESILKRLKDENTKSMEIYNFLEGIKEVYYFSNLDSCFKEDLPNLELLVGKIDECGIEEFINEKPNKRVVMNMLKSKLDDSLEILKQ